MRVVVCDEHNLFAEALAAVLNDRSGTGEVAIATRAHAIAAAERRELDVAVIDLDAETGDDAPALDAVGAIAAADSPIDVIVLTEGSDDSRRELALRAGARACIDKRAPLQAVLDAIERKTISGLVEAPEPVASQWSPAALANFLTAREREVLDGLVRGESTSCLATRLGVGEATARSHVQNLLGKLGVHSRLEAVLFAVNHHLVVVDDLSGDREEISA